MSTKTASTMNDELTSKAGRENEQIITCHGCVNLDTADCESGVGWCNFHWQYRSIGTPRTCEGAQFFKEEL